MTEIEEEVREFIESGIRPVAVEDVIARAEAPRTQRHRTHQRVLVGAIVGVGAVAIALIVTLVFIPSRSPGGPTSAAAVELRLLASRAADISTLAPGQYSYSEIETQTNEIGATLAPGVNVHEYLNGTEQTWVNAQGYGRMVTTTDPTPQFYSEADRAAWKAAGSPPVPVPPAELKQTVTITPTWAGGYAPGALFQVGDLPTNPAALEQALASGRYAKQLNRSAPCTSSNCIVVATASALLQGPDVGATPALRSALFEVLSHVPGVVDLGEVTGKGGLSGIGLSFTHTNPGQTLSVHCATGGAEAHTNSDGTVVPYQPTTIGPAIPFQMPSVTTALEMIIDPETTSVISTQVVPNPDMQPVANVCPGQMGYGGKAPLGFVAPTWTNVLSLGVVNSETATPAGNS